MNILHLRASNFYGGPERQIHLHARAALGTDYHVAVASFTESGDMPEYLKVIAGDGIPTHLFQVSSAYDTRVISDIRTYLREHNIHILCTHDYRTTVLGCLAVRRTPTRWLAFSRGFTKDNFKVRLYHAIDKFLIRQAAHIVAVSGAQKEKLRRLFIKGNRITVVPNAIDPDRFAGIPPVNLRERFGFDLQTVVCVAGGRFSSEKGQLYLIEAAALALKRSPALRLVLFGDGPDLETARSRVNALGISNEVHCPGFEKNLLGCLKGADLLVNPSLSEGLPNIVLEGMALNVPVVATSVGGVPEIISDGRTGRLVPPKRADLLAQAIVAAAEDRDESHRMARAAHEFVRAEYSFRGQFEKLTAVYESLR
jgi:glycosyltransferase involved in cell wall biosynthesis